MSWLVMANPSAPCRWMLVDTLEDEKPHGRGRVVAQFDDEIRAQAVAAMLAESDREYRGTLTHLEDGEPFS
jgi:hypothetical protein